MIVMKFGGTSTQDAAAMTNVAQIVKARIAQHPIVVVSAIAQSTNMLETAGKLAADGKAGEGRDMLLKLFDRHFAIVDELVKNKQRHVELRKILSGALAELEELVKGVSIIRELTPRTLDAFYCYGELMSSRIVASVLQEHEMQSQWVDTKDFMVTDENHNRAMPLMDVIEQKLNDLVLPLVQKGVVVVTQGFTGATLAGRRTTMGRESSDYSASIIGAALHVSDVQIWTDVDGILTADPRVVAAPRKVKTLSFEEAYELSYFGAKVLHPNTMLPAIEKNIPIHIYNSKRPSLSGTMVISGSPSSDGIVKSVAYKRNVILLTVTPKKRFNQYIFWEHIYSILTKHDVVASLTASSEYSVSIALEGVKNISAIVQGIEEIGVVQIREGKSIICVVGSNIRDASDSMKKVFDAISGLTVSMISFGASTSSVSIIIDDEYILDAVRRIHKEFFEMSGNEEVFETLAHFSAQA